MSIWNDLARRPFELAFVDVDGVPTRSLRAGDGPAVLLLHGTSSHVEVFTPNVPAYAEAGYRAHAIDMIGHGYTGKPAQRYEVPDYVEHVRRYLEVCGIERVHLVGESLGGWVAAWFASEYPEQVASLQLVSSGGTLAVPEVMARIRETTTRAATEDDIAFTRERLSRLFHDPAQLSEDLVEARYRIYHQPEFQKILPRLLVMQDMETRQRNLLRPDRMGRIRARTQIFWGRHNPMGATPEAEGILAAIPDASLTVYEECGHFPQLEHPERFNRESVAFLDSVDGSR